MVEADVLCLQFIEHLKAITLLFSGPPLFLISQVTFWWEAIYHLCYCPPWMSYYFGLASYSFFYFLVLSSSTIICLGVVFFAFILLMAASWMCGRVSGTCVLLSLFIRKIFGHFIFKYSFCFILSCPSRVYMYYIFSFCPTCLLCFFLYFSFLLPLCFSLDIFFFLFFLPFFFCLVVWFADS